MDLLNKIMKISRHSQSIIQNIHVISHIYGNIIYSIKISIVCLNFQQLIYVYSLISIIRILFFLLWVQNMCFLVLVFHWNIGIDTSRTFQSACYIIDTNTSMRINSRSWWNVKPTIIEHSFSIYVASSKTILSKNVMNHYR
jgi:hypothetical protein